MLGQGTELTPTGDFFAESGERAHLNYEHKLSE